MQSIIKYIYWYAAICQQYHNGSIEYIHIDMVLIILILVNLLNSIIYWRYIQYKYTFSDFNT